LLKIRKEQEDVFRQRALADFESRAIKHLRRDLGEQTAPFDDHELRRRVHEGITRAGSYGLTTEKQVMCFVDVTFLLGESFDAASDNTWVSQVLRNSMVSAGDRANLLLATACSLYQGKHIEKSRS
jgi:hypothetical protein